LAKGRSGGRGPEYLWCLIRKVARGKVRDACQKARAQRRDVGRDCGDGALGAVTSGPEGPEQVASARDLLVQLFAFLETNEARQVMTLLLEGNSTREIAKAMGR